MSVEQSFPLASGRDVWEKDMLRWNSARSIEPLGKRAHTTTGTHLPSVQFFEQKLRATLLATTVPQHFLLVIFGVADKVERAAKSVRCAAHLDHIVPQHARQLDAFPKAAQQHILTPGR